MNIHNSHSRKHPYSNKIELPALLEPSYKSNHVEASMLLSLLKTQKKAKNTSEKMYLLDKNGNKITL